MKYTEEQKRILALCRKYKGVKPVFYNHNLAFNILSEDKYYYFNNEELKNGKFEEWLKTNCELKQVGRPKGSTKPSGKVKRDISLSADQWSKVEEIRRMQGLKYASHAIGLAVEAFSKSRTALEIQSMIGNDCCICKHVEYCPNATWENDKLNTCSKWQIATSTFGYDGLKIGGE